MQPERDPKYTVEFCYRHPRVQTGVHCTRCGRPICPDCMVEAPVGYQCPDCVGAARKEFARAPGRRTASMRTAVRLASLTNTLLALIIAMYLVEVALSGPGALIDGPTPRTMIDLGGAYPPAIADGQLWRLFTSMFLHYGLIHLAMNAYGLWLIGNFVEQRYGRSLLLLAFVVTGLFASAVAYAFGDTFGVGAGASGALFGLFGLFFVYAFRQRRTRFGRGLMSGVYMTIVINIVIGLSIPNIGIQAHIGGFIGGAGLGFLMERLEPGPQRVLLRILGIAAMLAIGIVLVAWRSHDIRAQLVGLLG